MLYLLSSCFLFKTLVLVRVGCILRPEEQEEELAAATVEPKGVQAEYFKWGQLRPTALRHATSTVPSWRPVFIGSKFQNHVFLAKRMKEYRLYKKMPLHWLHGKEGWNIGKILPFQYGPSIEQCLLSRVSVQIQMELRFPSPEFEVSSCNNHVGVQKNHEGHQFCQLCYMGSGLGSSQNGSL